MQVACHEGCRSSNGSGPRRRRLCCCCYGVRWSKAALSGLVFFAGLRAIASACQKSSPNWVFFVFAAAFCDKPSSGALLLLASFRRAWPRPWTFSDAPTLPGSVMTIVFHT